MSHDRGCFRCNEDPSEYARCQRANCPKRGKVRLDRTDPEGGIPGRGDMPRTTTRIKPTGTPRPATRIVSVTNPGHDVLLFMHRDGSAHAVITRPGDNLPTTVLIAAPEVGRCIAIKRRGASFDVVYKDEEML